MRCCPPVPAVGPGVLIPRPETELMIDFVQEAVAATPALASGAWADLGTGSGALAVGLARALPQADRVGWPVAAPSMAGCASGEGQEQLHCYFAACGCGSFLTKLLALLPTPPPHPTPPHPHQVFAVDLSPTPLAYAAFNAQRLGVGARLTPLLGSWYEPLAAAGVRRLAGVVSNPPYICSDDMAGLQSEVGR